MNVSVAEPETETQQNSTFVKDKKPHTRADKKRQDGFARFEDKIQKKSKTSEFICGNFKVTKEGLYYCPPEPKNEDNKDKENPDKESDPSAKKNKKNSPSGPIRISSPIWPEAHLRSKDGKDHSLLLRVNDGERDHLWAMPKRLITKTNDIYDVLLSLGQDIPLYPGEQKLFQQFLMKTSPKKKMRCVDRAGWHDGQYVFPDGEIIGDVKDGNESVYPVNETYAKGIGNQGTLSEWQENVVSLCANNSRLIFSLGVGFASVCLNIIGSESGGFNLRGPSSKGKSKCLRAAISVIGSPEYERTWKATSNGLEATCVLHNDGLLALDEMGESKSEEIGQIAYSICSGIEKTRMNRSITAREARNWRVLLLSTAEIPLDEHMREGKKQAKAGQLVRIIDVPAICHPQYGCFEDIHNFGDSKTFADTVAERCKKFYGTAIRKFIQEVINLGMDEAKKELMHAKDDFVADNATNCDGQVKRVADRFGVVYGALLFAAKYRILGNAITFDMIKSAVSSCFHSWLAGRGTTGDLESHNLVDKVIGMLNENSDSKFSDYFDNTKQPIRQSLWGYKLGARFYVFPTAFGAHLCRGMNQVEAADILKEKKLLLPGKKKNSQIARIPAHTKKVDRFYILDLAMIQDDAEDEEDVTC